MRQYLDKATHLKLLAGTSQSPALSPIDDDFVVRVRVVCRFFTKTKQRSILDAAYEYRKGKPMHIPSISLLLADVVFSLLVQTLFLVQTMALNLIPYVGSYLSFFSHCLLYSLYSCKFTYCFWFKVLTNCLSSRI